ncbi:MAG: hypothetical protein ACK4MM_03195 [Fervidobacterium sp.]
MLKTMFKPLLKNKKFIIGITIFALFILLGILGPLIYRVDPTEMTWDTEQGPSKVHPLGTDTYGRDILAQLLHGIRASLYVGFLAAIISLTIGVIIGTFEQLKKELLMIH